MHIEPGLVDSTKIVLSYATGGTALIYSAKLVLDALRDRAGMSLAVRSLTTTACVFSFFQILPHYSVGVSEVHLILGSTLFLLFGQAPAAIGLAMGLLLQGLLFEPLDLPQYGMNVTTLLVPLFAMAALAQRLIPSKTAYVDLRYGDVLKLSLGYQAGVVAWVGFWVIYGQGLTMANVENVMTFGSAYLLVVVIEPLVDLAVLAGAKTLRGMMGSHMLETRLYQAA